MITLVYNHVRVIYRIYNFVCYTKTTKTFSKLRIGKKINIQGIKKYPTIIVFLGQGEIKINRYFYQFLEICMPFSDHVP